MWESLQRSSDDFVKDRVYTKKRLADGQVAATDVKDSANQLSIVFFAGEGKWGGHAHKFFLGPSERLVEAKTMLPQYNSRRKS